ncbi:glycosyltransferase family 1 protein [Flavicella sp.]|uniref:glycosyltransferase family 4 protein n=1 Tax=Flavicella sp. TaxID=2957742 RepID=UPI0030160EB9
MKKDKKVLLDLERLRYPYSGIANVFRNLALGFNKLKSEIELDISLYGPLNELQSLDTQFKIVNHKSIHKVMFFFTAGYSILHSSHQLSSYFNYKRKWQKKIVTLHDLNFLREDFSENKKNQTYKIVKKNISNADVIVCISNFTKKDLLLNDNLFRYKTKPEIIVIHNGLKFPELKEYPLGRFSFLKEKKYILNIGVLFFKKNQILLVKMLPFIDEDLVLVVSGEKEDYKNEMLSEIKRLNLTNRVHIISNIPEDEKWALIQNATSMCHPSLAEGFGIPPIEAMYFGKPVFLSNLTSLPEIGGEVAYYFDSFEIAAMVTVYRQGMNEYNSDKVNQVIKLNSWALNYDYEKMAKKYLELYKRL